MHQIEVLKDVVIIFGLASLVVYLFNKMKLPSVVGFLITGIIAGPYGLGLIDDKESTKIMAEIGVILLLFTIGIEFSIRKLIRIRNIVLLGGALQVLLTIVTVWLLSVLLGIEYNIAVFFGFLVALSSTAIILKVLQDTDQIGTHHGKIGLGILIFQDLIVVPMMLLIPFLSGASENIGAELFKMGWKSLILIGFTFVLARWVVPYILHKIAQSNSQELFLISIILIGFAVANLSALLGLSLALGAFLAGLAISESEYKHQAFGNLVPFRDIFSSFFFVSIGMLLNAHFFAENAIVIILIALGVIVLKSTLIGFVSFVLGFPFKVSLRAGIILSQIGEFSFILAQIGRSNGLIDGYYYQLFLAVAVLSMSVTPLLIIFAEPITSFLERLPMPNAIRNGFRELPKPQTPDLKRHTILIGGRKTISGLIRSLKLSNIDTVVIDLDADRVRELQKRKIPAVYGHAQYPSVLEQAKVKDAQNMIISINDTSDSASIISMAKRLNPAINIILRTKFLKDLEYLYEVGADYVVPVEFETYLGMLSKALSNYLVPNEEIDKTLAFIRSRGYKALRSDSIKEVEKTEKIDIPNFEISSFVVHEESLVLNKSIKALDLRRQTGVSILAVKRGDKVITNPDSNTVLELNDTIYTLGNHYNTTCINELFTKHLDKEEME